MPLRPRKRLPTALEMEFPTEMAFQSRWKWNCVHAMGFQPRWKWNCVRTMGFQSRWKWNFRRKWPSNRASNHVGNGISVGNGLPIALEMEFARPATISHVLERLICMQVNTCNV